MFYEKFKIEKDYSPELQQCIEETVEKLEKMDTTEKQPGMLLGRIQSGKTRAFIGIIALAFDKGYDISIILTKGTRALSEQTVKRLKNDFASFRKNRQVEIKDIMKAQEDMTRSEVNRKLIFIVKKEKNNLDRLQKLFFESEHKDIFAKKKVLIIDDEADFAGIGFRKNKLLGNSIEYKTLAKMISEFRTKIHKKSDFLQVTATPYSLYLQPENPKVGDTTYLPMKPKFTSIVPTHDKYIGGRFYFEESEHEEYIAYYIYNAVPEGEIELLKDGSNRYLETILITPNFRIFRKALMNFLVGGSIRTLQNEEKAKEGDDLLLYSCAFILHTEVGKTKHLWQGNLVRAFCSKLEKLIEDDKQEFENLIESSYNDLMVSVKLTKPKYKPTLKAVIKKVKESLVNGCIDIKEINSDRQVLDLLDEDTGQLKLSSEFNIFVGGQVIDRGITIDNLIGFFYGRNPKKFQQDTVLQHSRMYGTRSPEDCAVTRFYTTPYIYEAMKRIHEFDEELRNSFVNGEFKYHLVFLRKDEKGQIRPCSPDKILLSDTTTIKPYKRLLQYGFQTKSKTEINKTVEEIDKKLTEIGKDRLEKGFLIDLDFAKELIDKVNSTYTYEKKESISYERNVDEFKACLDLCDSKLENSKLKKKVYCFVAKNREISRYKDNGNAFSNSPEDGKTDGKLAKALAKEIPCIIMLKQKGEKSKGWKDAEFWWYIIYCPESITPFIFTSEVIKEDETEDDE